MSWWAVLPGVVVATVAIAVGSPELAAFAIGLLVAPFRWFGGPSR